MSTEKSTLTNEQRLDVEIALRWIQPACPAHRILTEMLSRYPAASAAPAEGDNWQQYAKEGETAQQCIERHRAEQDALLKLYGTPTEGREAVDERAAFELNALQLRWIADYIRDAYECGFRDAKDSKEYRGLKVERDGAKRLAEILRDCAKPRAALATAPTKDPEEDAPLSPAAERAVRNTMTQWHLIRLLTAWRTGKGLNDAGIAAFEWARENGVGKEALEAIGKGAVSVATAPTMSEDFIEAHSTQSAKALLIIATNHS